MLKKKDTYKNNFNGRNMQTIQHTGNSSLKKLKGVLALWINDENKVDSHCKVKQSFTF